MNWVDDDELPDYAVARAVWRDGHVHPCSSVTVGTVRGFKAAASVAGQRASEFLFDGEHCITHHRITVRRRPDKGLLISLYDQEKHACTTKVELWATESDEDKEAECVVQRAASFMCALAVEYVANKLDADTIYAARDERMKALGLLTRSPGLRKKPCGATREDHDDGDRATKVAKHDPCPNGCIGLDASVSGRAATRTKARGASKAEAVAPVPAQALAPEDDERMAVLASDESMTARAVINATVKASNRAPQREARCRRYLSGGPPIDA